MLEIVRRFSRAGAILRMHFEDVSESWHGKLHLIVPILVPILAPVLGDAIPHSVTAFGSICAEK